jgi:hypothetical protein
MEAMRDRRVGLAAADALCRKVYEAETAALEAADALEHLGNTEDLSPAILELADKLAEWSRRLRILGELMVRAEANGG